MDISIESTKVLKQNFFQEVCDVTVQDRNE